MCQKSFFFTFLQFFVFWAWRIFSSMSSHRRVLRTSAWIPQRSAKIGNSLSQHVCLLHVGTGLYKTWEQCLALVHLNFGSTPPCFQHSQILLCHLKHEPFYKLQCISQIKRSSSAHLPISRLRWIACVAFKMRFNIEYLMIWKMWNSCCISVNSKTEISKQFTVYHWSTLQQAITKASKQMPFPWWMDQKCFVNWTAFIVTDQPGYAAHCI